MGMLFLVAKLSFVNEELAYTQVPALVAVKITRYLRLMRVMLNFITEKKAASTFQYVLLPIKHFICYSMVLVV